MSDFDHERTPGTTMEEEVLGAVGNVFHAQKAKYDKELIKAYRIEVAKTAVFELLAEYPDTAEAIFDAINAGIKEYTSKMYHRNALVDMCFRLMPREARKQLFKFANGDNAKEAVDYLKAIDKKYPGKK